MEACSGRSKQKKLVGLGGLWQQHHRRRKGFVFGELPQSRLAAFVYTLAT